MSTREREYLERGALEIGVTKDGDVGVWRVESSQLLARGDTVAEALSGLGLSGQTAEAEPDALADRLDDVAEAMPFDEAKIIRSGGYTISKADLREAAARLRSAPTEDAKPDWVHDCEHWRMEGVACAKCNPASPDYVPHPYAELVTKLRAVAAQAGPAEAHGYRLVGPIKASLLTEAADAIGGSDVIRCDQERAEDGPGEPVAWAAIQNGAIVEVDHVEADFRDFWEHDAVRKRNVTIVPLYRTPPKDEERIEGWAWIIGRNPEESGVKFCAQPERPGWAPPGRYQPATLIIHGTPTEGDDVPAI